MTDALAQPTRLVASDTDTPPAGFVLPVKARSGPTRLIPRPRSMTVSMPHNQQRADIRRAD